MEILVLQDGKVFSRLKGDESAEYTLVTFPKAEVPAIPEEPAGVGKQWELDYVDGVLVWVANDRPLTTDEKLAAMQQDLDSIKFAWKAGEAVIVGDRRYYNGIWYVCLQTHTTQADWTPDVVPALWQAE